MKVLKILFVSTLILALLAIHAFMMRRSYEVANCYLPDDQIRSLADKAVDAGVAYREVDNFLKLTREACNRSEFRDEILDLLKRYSSVNLTRQAFYQLVDSLNSDVHYSGNPSLFENYRPPGVRVPLVYLNNQGFNVHHINSLNLATAALIYRNNWSEFLGILDGMLRYLEFQGDVAFFKFYFAWETAKIPWVSSISQGIGAGYYALAYLKTGNETYLEVARGLAKSFGTPLSKGGFRISLPEGPFYLEYSHASDDHVLNGFMLSLKGLSIYTKLVEDPIAKKHLEEGIATLIKILPEYDCGSWSLYSPKHGKANERYHRLHIRLLYYLGKVENVPALLEYAKKWDSYLIRAGAKSELPRAREVTDIWLSIIESVRS